jgi:hypothetical protein
MKNTEIEKFKMHTSELLWRHLRESHTEKYLNVEEIIKEITEYADYNSQEILQQIQQESKSAEQLAMETIILLTRGKIRMGVFNTPQGRMNTAGVRLSEMIDNISAEGKKKGYSSASKSGGCFGLLIGPILLLGGIFYGFIHVLVSA